MLYLWHRFEDLSAARLYELLAFRQAVFIVEQASAYPDLDGEDPACWHLAVRTGDGRLAGYARARGPSAQGPAFLGRIVVAPDQRGTGLGRAIVAEGLRFLECVAPGVDVRLSAQIHLERFYAGFGFVGEGEAYDDGGILHRTMWRRAPACAHPGGALRRVAG